MVRFLYELLEQSANQFPRKDAVIHQETSISYKELSLRTNQLAHVLQNAGVRRGDRVGIFLDKSIEAVVAIYGVLKAGAAYIPLDTSSPPKHVAFVVGNCDMSAIITTRKRLDLVISSVGPLPVRCAVLVDVGAEGGQSSGPDVKGWQDVLRAPEDFAPPADLDDADLAYVLYTSGSTGTPKGVMISHRASLAFVRWSCERIGVRHDDRVSNHAPLQFDLSTFDLFASACGGATVVLVPPGLTLFPTDLATFVEEQRISIWYSVPSALVHLVLRGGVERYRFAALRAVLFAGEVFPVKYLRQLMTLIPGAEYYNLYGPTETNVCTWYRVPSPLPEGDEPIPIGRACEGTEVFAVTDEHKLAAPGEVGELWVRGPTLMTGYWGMDEETHNRLVPDTLHPELDPQLAYRTGDLVKQDEQGDYLFIGRRDGMVKSRGYRIELGAIETVMNRHAVVEEAAVVAIPDELIGNELKAVVVLRRGAALGKKELLAFCAEHLPPYMLPGIVEIRDSLPKTATGKIDKNRLKL